MCHFIESLLKTTPVFLMLFLYLWNKCYLYMYLCFSQYPQNYDYQNHILMLKSMHILYENLYSTLNKQLMYKVEY